MKRIIPILVMIGIFIGVVIGLPLLAQKYVAGEVIKAKRRTMRESGLARYVPTYLPKGLHADKESGERLTNDYYIIEFYPDRGSFGGHVAIKVEKTRQQESKVIFPEDTLTDTVINGYDAKVRTSDYPTSKYTTVQWVENGRQISLSYDSGKSLEETKAEAIKIAQGLRETDIYSP